MGIKKCQRRRLGRLLVCCGFLFIAVAGGPGNAVAQSGPSGPIVVTPPATGPRLHPSGFVSPQTRGANVLINAALGAAAVAMRGAVARRINWRDVRRGAGGGALMSAGKQITGMAFDGSGLVGRQVHGIGVSLVASAGRDTLVLVFPIGPGHVAVRPGMPDRVRLRVDLFDLVVLASSAADRNHRFDAGASLSVGAPVFERKRAGMPQEASGVTRMGILYVADDLRPADRQQVLAHEGIHVLQVDAYRHLVAYPVERSLVRRLPGGSGVLRPFEIGVLAPASVYAVSPLMAYHQRPWEREAHSLIGESVNRD